MEEIRLILPGPFHLAEGPVWHENTQILSFVDIKDQSIHLCDANGNNHRFWRLPSMCGFAAPYTDDLMLIPNENHLQFLNIHNGIRKDHLTLDFPSYLRCNDGKCDPFGRLWVGTMATSQDHPFAEKGGCLYRVGQDTVSTVGTGFTIPNGMDWTRDGKLFYHTETSEGIIYAYDFSVGDGRIDNRRVAIKFSMEEGCPDGLTLDQKGMIWVALWGGSAIVRCDPVSGERLESISIPEQNVSSCVFGGDDYRTLYITTASDDAGQQGKLYALKTDVGGLPATPYRYEK